MKSSAQLSLFRRERRLPANPFLQRKTTLLDVLTFIGTAPRVSLRVIRLALIARRREIHYTVTFKNGSQECWVVDSTDQMIGILAKERRTITHVTNGKELIQ